MKMVWLPEDDVRLLELFKERKGGLWVAEQMGRTASSVYHRYWKLGQAKPLRPNPWCNDPKCVEPVTRLYAEGRSYKEIAAQTGLSKDTVSHIISKHVTVKRRKFEIGIVDTYDPTLVETVRRMFVDEKKTQRAITAELGLRTTVVKDICTSRGFRRPRVWSPEQMATMLSLLEGGASMQEVSNAVGKSVEACTARAIKVGLKERIPEVARQDRQRGRPRSMQQLLNRKLRTSKITSVKRGFEFTITLEYIESLLEQQGGKCHYTGRQMTAEALDPNQVSIDRVDSSRGYAPGNVVLCAWVVNQMKQDLPLSEFYSLCGSIVDHRRLNN